MDYFGTLLLQMFFSIDAALWAVHKAEPLTVKITHSSQTHQQKRSLLLIKAVETQINKQVSSSQENISYRSQTTLIKSNKYAKNKTEHKTELAFALVNLDYKTFPLLRLAQCFLTRHN